MEKIIKSSDTRREERIPPGQKITENFPVLHAGSVPLINLPEWKFKISGLVEETKVLNYREFMELPTVKVFSDIHCVTGWSKLNNTWEGVSSLEIKKLVKILPGAKFAIIHAAGGFTANLSLDDFSGEDVVFAIRHNSKELTKEHGFPVRLVVPRLYFRKSAKWVTGVEFTEKDKPGFWESRGYHNRGDPWKQERYGRGVRGTSMDATLGNLFRFREILKKR
ncbi:oxidoreductase [Candidatus Altiarchaeales archaeon WOR_SM1_SCG]|nr:oxidoreductase [Candidatus Altiarchaeales archaeon WOR_SM1_SCG]